MADVTNSSVQVVTIQPTIVVTLTPAEAQNIVDGQNVPGLKAKIQAALAAVPAALRA